MKLNITLDIQELNPPAGEPVPPYYSVIAQGFSTDQERLREILEKLWQAVATMGKLYVRHSPKIKDMNDFENRTKPREWRGTFRGTLAPAEPHGIEPRQAFEDDLMVGGFGKPKE